MEATKWYWCMAHERVESEHERDEPDNSLGPYDSPKAAREWKARTDARNEAWKEQDKSWFGEDDEDPDLGGGPVM